MSAAPRLSPAELPHLLPEASAALCEILAGAGQALLPPLRAEIFGPQRFAQHGRSLGATHRASQGARRALRGAAFFPRLLGNIEALRQAHRYIAAQAATGYDVSPAAEWLLDNFHLIEAQLKAVHEGLPKRYFRALPVLLDEPLAGLPRVYGVAWAFVAHTDGAFDEDLLVAFLAAYQETRELSLSEMWALPTTLRVVLIENLRRLAERVAAHKAAREAANLCCDRIDTTPRHSLERLLVLMRQRGVGAVFLAQMAQRLQDSGSASPDPRAERALLWLHKHQPDLVQAQAQQSADQTADNLSVSNAVSSLRAIGDADWPDIVARTSVLMRRMLANPLFAAEDTGTRDQTLHRIELLARLSGRSEVAVADTLLGLMQTPASPSQADLATLDSLSSHWLHGPGRPELLAALGVPARRAWAATLWSRGTWLRLALPLYLGALALGTLGLVAGLLGPARGWDVWQVLLAAALLLWPASEAVVALLNRLVSESTQPQHLPRLALAGGIPQEHRVLVVVPAFLTSTVATTTLVRRLLLHHLANPEVHAQFALLTDWADADSAETAGDAAVLAEARAQIQALNQQVPEAPGAPPRFIVLHRPRHFSPTEQRWIGWERKRGKLEQLVAALAHGWSQAFIDLGAESQLAPHTPYIVTLDSDTELPPGRLRELVGVAAHPHNQPRLAEDGHSVVAGYGILQPRIVTPLPAAHERTPFHWLFAGQCGIDPYSAASSEVYQDLFGEGSFTGKGLLHVQALHAVLSERLPEGQVLSHDLLEGALARCGSVSDITLVEDAPFHADVAAARVHRWMRGDWQLLPFLMHPRRHHLRALNWWKLFDNLRRSLVAPASLALLLWALLGAPVSPWAVLALLAAAMAAGPVMGAVAGLVPHRDDVAPQHFYRLALLDLARAGCGALWHWALWLTQALRAADAIVRSLYRMGISHRHLLQWTTASAAQAHLKATLAATLRRHALVPPLALGGMAALLLGTPHPLLTVLLGLLWAASPLLTWWSGQPQGAPREAALSPTDRAMLTTLAHDTWRFFERCVGADDHHLPPDNLQTSPQDMVAHRTSPTNIGLYLLSVACARQFGWIDTATLLARLEATLATLDQLARHRGHFLNWYDTQTLAPLLPVYVSTVDSGNLSGHLLAVGQACLELAGPEGEASAPSQRLRALARRCEALAWAADFSFLYHPKRHLLHIGYRPAEQQLDAGFYDLLASESRLTSLLAIAKGDVPVRHWAALGRLSYALGADAGLRSWSGSMFEYLMPSLVLAEPPGSVLADACHAALREQRDYAAALGVPWGISESAYAGRDHTLAYQYAPQGVPRLALRRTPPDELVIAPYASALAAMVAPHAACLNFAALADRGARGAYGFIEALDFTPARQGDGEAGTPVEAFMAHHQGMSLVALANVLLDGAPRRWGMANAHVAAVASLLHERAPREVSLLLAPPAGLPPQALLGRAPGLLREVRPGASAVLPTHLLSNGRYHVSLRANGAGTSRWGEIDISRWRDDALRDAHGSFFFLRRVTQAATAPLFSITQHPAPDTLADYTSTYHADRVCFAATWPDLQAHTTVWVSPEDDIEFRQVELRNLGDSALELELVSAFEVTLAPAAADEAHPAFTNMFVRAAWHAAQQALVFERTPRLATEQGVRATHFLAHSEAQVLGLRVQTDRQRWLGRNTVPGQAQGQLDTVAAVPAVDALTADSNDDTVTVLDTGLDPVCVLAVRLRIPAWGKARLTFASAAANQASVLHAVIDKYRQPSHVQRASLMSATLAGIRLRTLRLGAEHVAAIQMLTTALVLSLTRVQALAASTAARQNAPLPRLGEPVAPLCDRRLLWRFGLSGDRPIVLVSANAPQGLGLLRALAQALRLWSWGGIACDLVVINGEPASYQQTLQREIVALRERHGGDSGDLGGPAPAGSGRTGLFTLRAEELSPAELSTLHSLARLRFQADGRPLLHHLQDWTELHETAHTEREANLSTPLSATPRAAVKVSVPTGHFGPATGAFHFEVSPTLRPLRPWINVLSNPGFGAQLSEAGGGCTWALNSRLMQLSAWSNDPVADPPSEWFLLQDCKTRETWNVTPSAWGSAQTPDGEAVRYAVSHRPGSSRISHQRGDVAVNASWCVDADTAVKQVRITLVNRGHRSQHLRLIGVVEWLLGTRRVDRNTVRTSLHRQRLAGHKLTALLATQAEQAAGFGEGTAFLALAGADGDAQDGPRNETGDPASDWTCDRRECFNSAGRLALPDHFGKLQGEGLDPVAALATRVALAAGETVERVFLLGYAANPSEARQLASRAATLSASGREQAVHAAWDGLLSTIQVATPDPLFDVMVNRWLLYQTVSCRLWAKAGFYQAGGATGFRDQLQDSMALTWAAPGLLRAQIELCASRQFAEGDVQHWWHTPGGAGVRTHFSDDLLWLPHACVRYLRCTGDASLLDHSVPFLEGSAIAPGAEDVYETPRLSTQQASVYEHAARAIDHSLRVGVHGLPLMGSGDWNDGMNRVGHEGRGESVWLGWFLCQLVADFAPLAEARGDATRVARWQAAAHGWRIALLGPAWDGQWFQRAFFDDGSPLGSHTNREARIDLIAQAWAVLSNVAPLALQRRAMAAVQQHLVDPEAGLIKLLDPPLAHATPSAGYIQAYPPGVRENGGQYAHAGVWALMAQAQLVRDCRDSRDAAHDAAPGEAAVDTEAPYRTFTWLSPAHRAAHPTRGPLYGLEPYVMAGDVYSQPPYVGCGGWSWYTGAAAWLHRAAIESIFGLDHQAHTLSLRPCLPAHWPRAELTLRRDGRVMRFVLVRADAATALTTLPRPWGEPAAELLRPGQALAWTTLPASSCFVVPLGADRAAPQSEGSGTDPSLLSVA